MKLRVLILIDWFLPGNKAGGPVKSIYSMVKALNNKIDFYIITMNTDIASEKAYQLQANTWTKYEDINVFYFSNAEFSYKNIIRVIHQVSPDVIYINSFWSYKFSILPLLLKKINKIKVPIILAPRGMLETGAMDIKSFKKNFFLWMFKVIGLHKKIIFHATSTIEKQAIQKYYPSSEIVTVSNLSFIENNLNIIKKDKFHLKIFFLSRISPIKNLDFAIRVLSKIRIPSDSKIEYNIYGNNEDKEYFKYCRELISTLPANIKVTYKGVISFDKIAEIISQHHALLLPTKNENFGHAIVETLMCRRPVITSNYTPWNDINEYGCGFALPLNENIFAEKLLQMLNMNNEDFQQMCKNAETFVHKKLDVEKIKTEYLNLFKYAAQSK